MIRKFRINNYLKGRILAQMENYINNGSIQFEKGKNKNTGIVSIDETRIDKYDLQYMYKTLVPVNREIKY